MNGPQGQTAGSDAAPQSVPAGFVYEGQTQPGVHSELNTNGILNNLMQGYQQYQKTQGANSQLGDLSLNPPAFRFTGSGLQSYQVDPSLYNIDARVYDTSGPSKILQGLSTFQ